MKITSYNTINGTEYKNPFKENNIYPFNKIGRCIIDKNTAEIKRWCSEQDSNFDVDNQPINLDETNEDVCVYFPAFYYKRTWSGTKLTDEILSAEPDQTEIQGYKVHPAFVRKDGSFRNYILISAFKLSEVEGEYRSLPSKDSIVYGSISTVKQNLQKRNINYNVMNIAIVSMLQLLFRIGFQDLNSSKVIGNGQIKPSLKNTTMKMGNRTGLFIEKIGYANYVGVSVFGIDNLYGGYSYVVDGIYYENKKIYLTTFKEDFGILTNYKSFDYDVGVSGVGLFQEIFKTSTDFDYLNLPGKFGSSDANKEIFDKYYCDYAIVSTENRKRYLKFGDETSRTFNAYLGMFNLSMNNAENQGTHYLTYLS